MKKTVVRMVPTTWCSGSFTISSYTLERATHSVKRKTLLHALTWSSVLPTPGTLEWHLVTPVLCCGPVLPWPWPGNNNKTHLFTASILFLFNCIPVPVISFLLPVSKSVGVLHPVNQHTITVYILLYTHWEVSWHTKVSVTVWVVLCA